MYNFIGLVILCATFRLNGASSHQSRHGQSGTHKPSLRYSHHSQSGPLSSKIVYAGVPFRHGIRDATKIYGFTPASEREWSRGAGQLTPAGEEGMRKMGRELKRRYPTLLGNPKKTDIRAFSTASFYRNAYSARAMLEGIWENHKQIEIINYQIRWLTNHVRITAESKSIPEPEVVMEYRKKMAELIQAKTKYMENHKCLRLQENEMSSFKDTIMCEQANGVEHPPEITGLLSHFWRHKYWTYIKEHSTLLLRQSSAAPYISDVVGSMKKIVRGERGAAKFDMFSTHDSYIQTLVRTLDPFEPFDSYVKTYFGCSVMFELRRFNKQVDPRNSHSEGYYIVQIFYSFDTTLKHVKPLSLRDCTHHSSNLAQYEPFCFLSEFYRAMRPFTMDKYEYLQMTCGQECQNKNNFTRLTSGYPLHKLVYSELIIPV